jgi:twitching motility protein PilT
MAATGEPIERWLQVIWDLKGSDLHLTPASPPLVRIDGVLMPIEGEPALSPANTEQLVLAVLGDMAPRLERDRQVDFAFAWGSTARFRGNAYLQRGHGQPAGDRQRRGVVPPSAPLGAA